MFDEEVECYNKKILSNFSKFCMLKNITDEIWFWARAGRGEMFIGLGLYISDTWNDMYLVGLYEIKCWNTDNW